MLNWRICPGSRLEAGGIRYTLGFRKGEYGQVDSGQKTEVSLECQDGECTLFWRQRRVFKDFIEDE